MLSNMETSGSMDPTEARASLEAASAMRSHLAEALRLPSHFHLSFGVAIALQVGTTAWALTSQARSSVAVAVVVGGLAVFFAIAGIQLLRFRRLNGAWVNALVSRVVLGTSTLSSLVYAAGLAVSVWAGFADQWWLLALAAPVTGAAYAEAGRRWWSDYQGDPQHHARAGSSIHLAALAAFAVAGLVLAVVSGR